MAILIMLHSLRKDGAAGEPQFSRCRVVRREQWLSAHTARTRPVSLPVHKARNVPESSIPQNFARRIRYYLGKDFTHKGLACTGEMR